MHAATVDDVFSLVERRKADYGVVPIENSIEGAVTHTLDRFLDFVDTPVRIQGEIEQPIRHHLITYKRTKLSDIKIVFSHPQALAQCRQWLDKTLHHAHVVETASTAEAVEVVMDTHLKLQPYDDPRGMKPAGKPIRPHERAAIARAELAGRKKLKAIPIPENRSNKTRFLILGLSEPKKGQRSKTSIVFSLKDRPGALYDALVPFKRERINLTKIESRPSKKKAWEYFFFIDLVGHESEQRVKRALAALGRSTEFVKILGSYPVKGG